MVKVMFICTGNICRSAMAEAIMKEEVNKMGKEDQIEVYSAGTYAEDGDCASMHAIEAMEYYDIDLKGHRATSLRNSKIRQMDIILCATVEHKQIVLRLYPELKGKVYTMKEYAGLDNDGEDLNIKDPWGYNLHIFLECAKEISKCIDNILIKIIDK